MILQRPCVCGGLIVAGASWAVMDAVMRHNETPIHRKWRRRQQVVEANRAYRARMRRDVDLIRIERDVRREVAA